MTGPKVGDVFVSEYGRHVTVDDIQGENVVVKVERSVITRDGERKTDERERTVPKDLWSKFIQSYEKVEN